MDFYHGRTTAIALEAAPWSLMRAASELRELCDGRPACPLAQHVFVMTPRDLDDANLPKGLMPEDLAFLDRKPAEVTVTKTRKRRRCELEPIDKAEFDEHAGEAAEPEDEDVATDAETRDAGNVDQDALLA
eukprot:6473706-Amphidinium_carterae.1